MSSILVRDLIETYKYFKYKEVIALVKGGNISKGDQDMFTTVVTLWNINEKIIDHNKIYPKSGGKLIRIRPSDNKIKEQRREVVKYWDKFFKLFPSVTKFINDSKENRKTYRVGGGNFLLRPIAQKSIFEIMILFEDLTDPMLNKLKKLPLKLNNKFWHYILWEPHKSTMLFNKSLVVNYIKYNIGIELKKKELEILSKSYKKNTGDLELNLPAAKFLS